MSIIYHGGDVWQGISPADYLDFSSNLNPEGQPRWVRAAMAEGLQNAAYYPDARGVKAHAGASAFLGLPVDCLMLTGGGIEAVALVADMPIGCEHVITEPTFQEYAHFCHKRRSIDRSELDDYAPQQGDCLWLCNPNNPTGDAMPRVDVIHLLERMERAGGRLVVDEAFIDYCPEHTVRDLVVDHPALIVLGSLTKVLAIPGIRLGWITAHPTVIAQARERSMPWRLNCVAAAVAEALPEHEADFVTIRVLNERRRLIFADELHRIGARVYPSEANFLLCDFGRDMRPTIDALREELILVRPCGMFPGLTHGHIRLCVRSEGENGILIGALGQLLRE